jgi:hypothetical protein
MIGALILALSLGSRLFSFLSNPKTGRRPPLPPKRRRPPPSACLSESSSTDRDDMPNSTSHRPFLTRSFSLHHTLTPHRKAAAKAKKAAKPAKKTVKKTAAPKKAGAKCVRF